MAACLITFGGTSGDIMIRYTQDGETTTTYTSFSVDPFYIDDSATDVTYTTLSGDVTASSGCVTITELEVDYYLVTYDRLKSDTSTYDARFDAVVVDTTVNALSPDISDKFASWSALVTAINDTLADDTVKVTGYKVGLAGASTNYYQIELIIRVIGGGIPALRINSHFDNKSHLIGVTSAALPVGFTEIDIPLFGEIPS